MTMSVITTIAHYLYIIVDYCAVRTKGYQILPLQSGIRRSTNSGHIMLTRLPLPIPHLDKKAMEWNSLSMQLAVSDIIT